jgi:hypothetical protein
MRHRFFATRCITKTGCARRHESLGRYFLKGISQRVTSNVDDGAADDCETYPFWLCRRSRVSAFHANLRPGWQASVCGRPLREDNLLERRDEIYVRC